MNNPRVNRRKEGRHDGFARAIRSAVEPDALGRPGQMTPRLDQSRAALINEYKFQGKPESQTSQVLQSKRRHTSQHLNNALSNLRARVDKIQSPPPKARPAVVPSHGPNAASATGLADVGKLFGTLGQRASSALLQTGPLGDPATDTLFQICSMKTPRKERQQSTASPSIVRPLAQGDGSDDYDEAKIDEFVHQFKRLKKRPNALVRMQAWLRMIKCRIKFRKVYMRRRQFLQEIIAVWRISNAANRLTRRSMLRKCFNAIKNEVIETKEMRAATTRVFKKVLTGGKVSSMVLHMFFNDRVQGNKEKLSRDTRIQRRKRMIGYGGWAQRSTGAPNTERTAAQTQQAGSSGAGSGQGSGTVTASRTRVQSRRTSAVEATGDTAKLVVQGRRSSAVGAAGGAGGGRVVHKPGDPVSNIGAAFDKRVAKLNNEDVPVDQDDPSDDETDLFEQLRQTLEVHVKSHVLRVLRAGVRRRKQHLTQASMRIQKVARSLVRGKTDLWMAERQQLIMRMWFRWAKFRAFRRNRLGVPLFETVVPQWNAYVDKYQQRKLRERDALRLTPKNLSRRMFEKWRRVKWYRMQRKARSRAIVLEYNRKLLTRCLLGMQGVAHMRTSFEKLQRNCLYAWHALALNKRRLNQRESAVKAMREHLIRKQMWKHWRQQRYIQSLIRVAGVATLHAGGDAGTLAQMAVHAWTGRNPELRMIQAWRAWSRLVKRQRVWRQFLFFYLRERSQHLTRTVFSAWRDHKKAGRQQLTKYDLLPVFRITEYRRALVQIERIEPIENETDALVLKRLLLSPPPSDFVLEHGGQSHDPLKAKQLRAQRHMDEARAGLDAEKSVARSAAMAGQPQDGDDSSVATDLPDTAALAAEGADADQIRRVERAKRFLSQSPQRSAMPETISASPSAMGRQSSQFEARAPSRSGVPGDAFVTRRGSVVHLNTETELHVAANEGDLEKVRALLEAGEDPNGRNSAQETPLHLAARHYSDLFVPVVILLVEAGAHVMAEDMHGKSALQMAMNDKVVLLLTEHIRRIEAGRFTTYERTMYEKRMMRKWQNVHYGQLWRAVVHLSMIRRRNALIDTRKAREERYRAEEASRAAEAEAAAAGIAYAVGGPSQQLYDPNVPEERRKMAAAKRRAEAERQKAAAAVLDADISKEALRRRVYRRRKAVALLQQLGALAPKGWLLIHRTQDLEIQVRSQLQKFVLERGRLLVANALMRESIVDLRESSNQFATRALYRDAAARAAIHAQKASDWNTKQAAHVEDMARNLTTGDEDVTGRRRRAGVSLLRPRDATSNEHWSSFGTVAALFSQQRQEELKSLQLDAKRAALANDFFGSPTAGKPSSTRSAQQPSAGDHSDSDSGCELDGLDAMQQDDLISPSQGSVAEALSPTKLAGASDVPRRTMSQYAVDDSAIIQDTRTKARLMAHNGRRGSLVVAARAGRSDANGQYGAQLALRSALSRERSEKVRRRRASTVMPKHTDLAELSAIADKTNEALEALGSRELHRELSRDELAVVLARIRLKKAAGVELSPSEQRLLSRSTVAGGWALIRGAHRLSQFLRHVDQVALQRPRRASTGDLSFSDAPLRFSLQSTAADVAATAREEYANAVHRDVLQAKTLPGLGRFRKLEPNTDSAPVTSRMARRHSTDLGSAGDGRIYSLMRTGKAMSPVEAALEQERNLPTLVTKYTPRLASDLQSKIALWADGIHTPHHSTRTPVATARRGGDRSGKVSNTEAASMILQRLGLQHVSDGYQPHDDGEGGRLGSVNLDAEDTLAIDSLGVEKSSVDLTQPSRQPGPEDAVHAHIPSLLSSQAELDRIIRRFTKAVELKQHGNTLLAQMVSRRASVSDGVGEDGQGGTASLDSGAVLAKVNEVAAQGSTELSQLAADALDGGLPTVSTALEDQQRGGQPHPIKSKDEPMWVIENRLWAQSRDEFTTAEQEDLLRVQEVEVAVDDAVLALQDAEHILSKVQDEMHELENKLAGADTRVAATGDALRDLEYTQKQTLQYQRERTQEIEKQRLNSKKKTKAILEAIEAIRPQLARPMKELESRERVLKAAKSAYQKRVDTVREAMEVLGDADPDTGRAKESLAVAEKKVQRAEAGYRAAKAEVDKVQNVIDEHNASIEALGEKLMADGRTLLEDLEVLNDRLMHLNPRVEEARKVMQKARENNERLQVQVDDVRNALPQLEEDIEDAKLQLKQRREVYKQLVDEIEVRHKRRLADLKQSIAKSKINSERRKLKRERSAARMRTKTAESATAKADESQAPAPEPPAAHNRMRGMLNTGDDAAPIPAQVQQVVAKSSGGIADAPAPVPTPIPTPAPTQTTPPASPPLKSDSASPKPTEAPATPPASSTLPHTAISPYLPSRTQSRAGGSRSGRASTSATATASWTAEPSDEQPAPGPPVAEQATPTPTPSLTPPPVKPIAVRAADTASRTPVKGGIPPPTLAATVEQPPLAVSAQPQRKPKQEHDTIDNNQSPRSVELSPQPSSASDRAEAALIQRQQAERSDFVGAMSHEQAQDAQDVQENRQQHEVAETTAALLVNRMELDADTDEATIRRRVSASYAEGEQVPSHEPNAVETALLRPSGDASRSLHTAFQAHNVSDLSPVSSATKRHQGATTSASVQAVSSDSIAKRIATDDEEPDGANSKSPAAEEAEKAVEDEGEEVKREGDDDDDDDDQDDPLMDEKLAAQIAQDLAAQDLADGDDEDEDEGLVFGHGTLRNLANMPAAAQRDQLERLASQAQSSVFASERDRQAEALDHENARNAEYAVEARRSGMLGKLGENVDDHALEGAANAVDTSAAALLGPAASGSVSPTSFRAGLSRAQSFASSINGASSPLARSMPQSPASINGMVATASPRNGAGSRASFEPENSALPVELTGGRTGLGFSYRRSSITAGAEHGSAPSRQAILGAMAVHQAQRDAAQGGASSTVSSNAGSDNEEEQEHTVRERNLRTQEGYRTLKASIGKAVTSGSVPVHGEDIEELQNAHQSPKRSLMRMREEAEQRLKTDLGDSGATGPIRARPIGASAARRQSLSLIAPAHPFGGDTDRMEDLDEAEQERRWRMQEQAEQARAELRREERVKERLAVAAADDDGPAGGVFVLSSESDSDESDTLHNSSSDEEAETAAIRAEAQRRRAALAKQKLEESGVQVYDFGNLGTSGLEAEEEAERREWLAQTAGIDPDTNEPYPDDFHVSGTTSTAASTHRSSQRPRSSTQSSMRSGRLNRSRGSTLSQGSALMWKSATGGTSGHSTSRGGKPDMVASDSTTQTRRGMTALASSVSMSELREPTSGMSSGMSSPSRDGASADRARPPRGNSSRLLTASTASLDRTAVASEGSLLPSRDAFGGVYAKMMQDLVTREAAQKQLNDRAVARDEAVRKALADAQAVQRLQAVVNNPFDEELGPDRFLRMARRNSQAENLAQGIRELEQQIGSMAPAKPLPPKSRLGTARGPSLSKSAAPAKVPDASPQHRSHQLTSSPIATSGAHSPTHAAGASKTAESAVGGSRRDSMGSVDLMADGYRKRAMSVFEIDPGAFAQFMPDAPKSKVRSARGPRRKTSQAESRRASMASHDSLAYASSDAESELMESMAGSVAAPSVAGSQVSHHSSVGLDQDVIVPVGHARPRRGSVKSPTASASGPSDGGVFEHPSFDDALEADMQAQDGSGAQSPALQQPPGISVSAARLQVATSPLSPGVASSRYPSSKAAQHAQSPSRLSRYSEDTAQGHPIWRQGADDNSRNLSPLDQTAPAAGRGISRNGQRRRVMQGRVASPMTSSSSPLTRTSKNTNSAPIQPYPLASKAMVREMPDMREVGRTSRQRRARQGPLGASLKPAAGNGSDTGQVVSAPHAAQSLATLPPPAALQERQHLAETQTLKHRAQSRDTDYMGRKLRSTKQHTKEAKARRLRELKRRFGSGPALRAALQEAELHDLHPGAETGSDAGTVWEGHGPGHSLEPAGQYGSATHDHADWHSEDDPQSRQSIDIPDGQTGARTAVSSDEPQVSRDPTSWDEDEGDMIGSGPPLHDAGDFAESPGMWPRRREADSARHSVTVDAPNSFELDPFQRENLQKRVNLPSIEQPPAVNRSNSAGALRSIAAGKGPSVVSTYKLGLFPEIRPEDSFYRSFTGAGFEASQHLSEAMDAAGSVRSSVNEMALVVGESPLDSATTSAANSRPGSGRNPRLQPLSRPGTQSAARQAARGPQLSAAESISVPFPGQKLADSDPGSQSYDGQPSAAEIDEAASRFDFLFGGDAAGEESTQHSRGGLPTANHTDRATGRQSTRRDAAAPQEPTVATASVDPMALASVQAMTAGSVASATHSQGPYADADGAASMEHGTLEAMRDTRGASGRLHSPLRGSFMGSPSRRSRTDNDIPEGVEQRWAGRHPQGGALYKGPAGAVAQVMQYADGRLGGIDSTLRGTQPDKLGETVQVQPIRPQLTLGPPSPASRRRPARRRTSQTGGVDNIETVPGDAMRARPRANTQDTSAPVLMASVSVASAAPTDLEGTVTPRSLLDSMSLPQQSLMEQSRMSSQERSSKGQGKLSLPATGRATDRSSKASTAQRTLEGDEAAALTDTLRASKLQPSQQQHVPPQVKPLALPAVEPIRVPRVVPSGQSPASSTARNTGSTARAGDGTVRSETKPAVMPSSPLAPAAPAAKEPSEKDKAWQEFAKAPMSAGTEAAYALLYPDMPAAQRPAAPSNA